MTAPLAIEVAEHPRLRLVTFVTRFAHPLGETPSPASLLDLLRLDASTPVTVTPHAVSGRDEAVRADVRDMLRVGGYKPTGRGKPASEYLVRAAEAGALGAINLAVDACNVASLHSGFPISVVDLARARPPFRVLTAPAGSRYVFNASGQEIDLAGLLCLFDAEGPCANAVRDAQRTKTNAATTETLSLVWGCTGHEARLAATVTWYRSLLEHAGAHTSDE